MKTFLFFGLFGWIAEVIWTALYDFTTQSVMSILANANPPPGRRLELLSRKCASARKNLEAAP